MRGHTFTDFADYDPPKGYNDSRGRRCAFCGIGITNRSVVCRDCANRYRHDPARQAVIVLLQGIRDDDMDRVVWTAH